MSQKTIQKMYPLTPMQEGMMYHAMLDPESSAYFTQLELIISGHLDMTILQKSIDQLVDSYDILRTVFVHQQLKRPRQVVFAERQAKVHFENITNLHPAEQKLFLENYKHENQAKGFDLGKELLFRVAVFQLAEGTFHLIWSNHHILIDGWSLGILMKKLFEYYDALRNGLTLPVEPARPYGDYIKWLEKQDKADALGFWQKRLVQFEQPASLPQWNRPSADGTYQNAEFSFAWDEELVALIKQVANRYQVTASNLFQAVWGALLARYNNTDDVVFGTVVSGRPSAIDGIENMVGLFINTIPTRLRMDQGATFAELFTVMQLSALEAERYDYVPLYEIQNRSSLNQQLINHLLAFENYPLDRELENGHMEQQLGFSVQVAGAFEQTNYDFNLIVFPGEQWTIKMMYNASVYESQWIEKVAGHLTNIMQAAVRDPESEISRSCFLSKEERQELLETFNTTKVEYPREKTIQQLFEEQAGRVPDLVAVVFNDRQITYRELNAKANRLAAVLRGKGVGPDDIVGIMAERSVEMIVGILAILKSGGAYLPIDPAYPSDRIRFMLEDSGTALLLTHKQLIGHVDFIGETLDLDLDSANVNSDEQDAIYLEQINSPDDLAYIIYTSGTTGKPKGVMISHRNVVRLLHNNELQFSFSENDVWTMFHSFCFDFSVWEMYGALLYGGKLVVVPKHIAQSPHEFRDLLISEQVTVLNQTPTAFAQLMQRELLEPGKQLGIRYIVFGGEALKPVMLKEWHEKYPDTRLINMYGITETTVHVTFKEIGEQEIYDNISNIGGPIPTLGCYIMDKHLNLMPVGVIGELCVTGLGVARGYLHRPELTAERFFVNPHKPEERLYRSGDLARLLPNGELEYFGRMDNQVKIRGFRIELGEIESQLLKLKSITEAVVLARNDKHGHPMLCAYFVAVEELSVSKLRRSLSDSLPDYMVPAHFIQLIQMPVTSNGKLDLKVLPEPEVRSGTETYQEPSNKLEQQLAEIWQDVLGVDRISIDDDFFSLGGHSLKAMMLTSNIHQQLKRQVPIKILFERPTISQLAAYLQEAEEDTAAAIEAVPVRHYYPVSSAQKRLYILSQIEGAETSYNLPGVMTVEGPLDRTRFEEAFRKLVARHETLRTGFETVDGEIVQRVQGVVEFAVEYVQASEAETEESVRDFVRAFELQQAPLLRVGLIELERDRHRLLFDMHHIISDGISMGILVREFAQLYAGDELSPLRIQYKDYAAWQQERMQREPYREQETYWLETFAGELPVLDMPTDYARPAMRSFEGGQIEFVMASDLTAQLKRLATNSGSTLYMVLMAAYTILLAKYSGQADIIVGTPIAGRMSAELEPLIGMFVNTLAMRNYPAGEKTFAAYVKEVKENALNAYEHQEYPFEELVGKLNVARDLSRNPLFDTMFALQNIENGEMQVESLTFTPYVQEHRIAKFDLTFTAVEQGEAIGWSIEYSRGLYSEETMERMAGHFQQLVQSIVEQPDRLISSLTMMSAEETKQIVEVFNDTAADYPREKTIQQLFEEQVERTPDHVAVVFEDKQLTYRELNEQANQLARTLLAEGVETDQLVGIMAERSLTMIVGILGIIKSGATYVPIDLDYPEERIQYLLDHSQTKVVLTQKKHLANISPKGVTVLAIEDLLQSALILANDNLNITHNPERLFYVLYTSGTTGNPKGLMIKTHAFVNLLNWYVTEFGIAKSDRVLMIAPISFDLAQKNLFCTLITGGTLCLFSSGLYDYNEMSYTIEKLEITIINCAPSAFYPLVDFNERSQFLRLGSLRAVFLGGEPINMNKLKPWIESKVYTCEIYNTYGPTECTDIASFYRIPNPWTEQKQSISIGKPINNVQIYILDQQMNLMPIGVVGELCIGGTGLATGYYRATDLTEEKFVSCSNVPSGRIYKTGDLARWLPDGNIEYLGRMDHQVKIRGNRIELSEVETQLLQAGSVQEAVVIAREDEAGQKQLCAYIVAEKQLSVGELRGALSQALPGYMIPSYFVQLEKLPLTSNGKIDRKALPAPDGSMQTGVEYVAPRTNVEVQLSNIWQEVLGVANIGIQDNFFDIGGHSLRATTLVTKIHKEMASSISLREVFQFPTIEQMAQVITGTEQLAYTAIPVMEESEYYPLSPAQKRMYILHQIDGMGISYNMPSALMMEGEPDIARLEIAFQKLIERHETLRTSFTEVDGVPVQRVHEHVDFQCSVRAGEEHEAAELIKQFVRPFDLSSSPLIRAGIVRMAEHSHLLLIDMHHIIADGVSTGILIKQLTDLYKGIDLPAPKLHYKDFTMWQNEPVQQENIHKQELFWLEQFAGDIPVLQLPSDFLRPAVQSFAGGRIRFEADRETTLQMRTLAAETGVTLHMLLLAVFNVFLAKMSGQYDIVVGTAASGRRHADLQDVPGMFVNTLALRSAPEPDKTFRQFLQEIKITCLQALENQDYPFEELVGRLKLPRDLSRNPLFNVMLSLENPDSEPLRLDGLSLSPYELPGGISKFDLTLGAFENEEVIGLQFEYCSELFTKETVTRWSGNLLNMMRYIAERPDHRLSDIELMTAEEKLRLVRDWNQTEMNVPNDRTIHELFEVQVLRTPDHPAVAYKGRHWTYQELNARANRLAHVLIGKGIGPDQPVGIMVRPSLEMAAGVLAILKAGAAFVPIDPDYPEQRIAYMLSDSGAPILLVQCDLPVPEPFDGEVIRLDGELSCWAEAVGFDDETNPLTATGPKHLAYIIYTSGTTGQPKGVMIEHHSLVNLCFWHNEAFAVSNQDRSAKYAGFGFDASVWEMFPYWIAGAEVHIIDEAIRLDITQLNEYFEHNRITVTFLPTQLCEQFMELDNRSLRYLLTGGDKLKRSAERRYTLVNNYGPTESTVVASSTPIYPGVGTLSIGRPIANTRLYIVGAAGADNQLQPIGAAGELCIGGRGLARGYNNRPQETAEKFVEDPFMPGERMYRTGDLARWLDDGTIEYMGRIDQQVKVRGFRIELSEIESQLAQIRSVKAAAVKDIQDANGNTALCAYVVASDALNAGQLKQDLARKLPDYMVPQYWVMLDVLPLTANGKVDKKALSMPDITAAAAGYRAPETEVQQQLADIWQNVLGIPQVGIQDNFFALGGDSIKAIQMASRLRKLSWKLEMKDLFQHPTIEQVSPYLQWVQEKSADQGPVEGEVKLTPIQSWFFEQRFTDMHHWNQSVMLHAPVGFDPQTVAMTLSKIVEHHDALRMIYTAHKGGYAQYNRAPAFFGPSVEVVDFRGIADIGIRISDHATDIQKSINLSEGPLLKTAIFRTDQGDHLLIIVHHLVVDGVSWRILLEDFATGYEQAAKGQPIVFQEKTNSFKEWSEQLETYASSELFLKQAEFWRQIEAAPIMPLPKDNNVASTKEKDSVTLSFELTLEETHLLLTDVHRPYRTEINDILLCALGLVVGEWTGQSKLCLNLEGHGREEIIPGMNVSRTVGWFTSQYPVVLEINPDAPLPTLIKATKESLRSIPDKGIGYGILNYLTTSRHTAELAFPLKPEISFNYLGQFDREVQTDFFGPSPYGMGHQMSLEAESLYPLNFNGIVHGGRLIVSCSFNKQQYFRGTINGLMARFQHHLLQIIHHCVSKEDRDFTPSDFSAGNLRMDEMEDIFGVLGEKLS